MSAPAEARRAHSRRAHSRRAHSRRAHSRRAHSRRAHALALAWAPAALYMALIWGLSSFALAGLPIERFPLGDKGVHFIEYGLLGGLLAHACFRTWPRHHVLRTATLAVFVTVLWGFVDEIHQAFVPGRSSDVLDLVADALGASVGAGARFAASFLGSREQAEG